MRKSGGSGEGYCAVEDLPKLDEHLLIRDESASLRMCKEKNISYMLKQTLNIFNDRVMYGKHMKESEFCYKEQLLKHGAYFFLSTSTSNVYAASVFNKGFEFGTTPWSKIDGITCRQFGKGYGSLLMKHMIDAAYR